MYDYVLQLSFPKNIQTEIQNIKDEIKKNNIKDKEKSWKPHITIDLYNCKKQDEFIKKVDSTIEKLRLFNIECKNLNNFNEETLYIEPYNKEELYQMKLVFDNELEEYRLEHRKTRIYQPHITLCTNSDLSKAKLIANKKFKAFKTQVNYLWIYNSNLELIKQYELKKV